MCIRDRPWCTSFYLLDGNQVTGLETCSTLNKNKKNYENCCPLTLLIINKQVCVFCFWPSFKCNAEIPNNIRGKPKLIFVGKIQHHYQYQRHHFKVKIPTSINQTSPFSPITKSTRTNSKKFLKKKIKKVKNKKKKKISDCYNKMLWAVNCNTK